MVPSQPIPITITIPAHIRPKNTSRAIYKDQHQSPSQIGLQCIHKQYVPIDKTTHQMVTNIQISQSLRHPMYRIAVPTCQPILVYNIGWRSYVLDDAFKDKFSTAFVALTGLPDRIHCSLSDYQVLVYRLYKTIQWLYEDNCIELAPHRRTVYNHLSTLTSALMTLG